MNKFETMSQDNLEQEKNQLISQLGSSLHEEWRAPRKKEDGSFQKKENEVSV